MSGRGSGVRCAAATRSLRSWQQHVVETLVQPLWWAREGSSSRALYHQRWEIEAVFDELKTHQRQSKWVLLLTAQAAVVP
jgi:hypothetical protein